MTLESRQIELMAIELAYEDRVALEQGRRLAPVMQQPPDPNPGDQSHTDLDAHGPVNAGKKRIGLPPGLELLADALGVAIVAGQGISGRQQREMMVARQLPDPLDVPIRRSGPPIDIEAVILPAGGEIGAAVPK